MQNFAGNAVYVGLFRPPPRPRRFFASLPIDAGRAGLDVAKIQEDLLLELTRGGARVTLTLEVHGEAGGDGYPKDVEDTVAANARDLKLDRANWGFEKE